MTILNLSIQIVLPKCLKLWVLCHFGIKKSLWSKSKHITAHWKHHPEPPLLAFHASNNFNNQCEKGQTPIYSIHQINISCSRWDQHIKAKYHNLWCEYFWNYSCLFPIISRIYHHIDWQKSRSSDHKAFSSGIERFLHSLRFTGFYPQTDFNSTWFVQSKIQRLFQCMGTCRGIFKTDIRSHLLSWILATFLSSGQTIHSFTFCSKTQFISIASWLFICLFNSEIHVSCQIYRF